MVCEHEYMNISSPNYRAGYSPGEIQVRKEICECLFGEPTEVRVHSSDSSDISAIIEDLKAGQLVNGEAIQALSQSIIHINAVLRRLPTVILVCPIIPQNRPIRAKRELFSTWWQYWPPEECFEPYFGNVIVTMAT